MTTAATTPSLEQLKPLQLPDPVGWWPPAPGWWLLALLLVLLVGLLAVALYRHWQRNRYRRAALTELRQLEQQAANGELPMTVLSQLLRRTALHAYPDAAIAGLTTERWRAFLTRSSGLQGFEGPLGDALIQGPYAPLPQTIDQAALLALVRQWIQRHRRRLPC